MDETLRDRLRRDLTLAMKRRDRVAMSAIRSALGAMDNAEAVEAPAVTVGDSDVIAGAAVGLGAGEAARRVLSGRDVVAVVRAEIATRTTVAGEYDALGGPAAEAAVVLRAEADVLRVYVDG